MELLRGLRATYVIFKFRSTRDSGGWVERTLQACIVGCSEGKTDDGKK